MRTLTNGDIILEYPDEIGDVLLYDKSVMERKPIEVRYNPNKGWGQVLVAYPEGEQEENLWNEGEYSGDNPRFSSGAAGQPQNFTLRGPIIVIYEKVDAGLHGHSSDSPTLVVV